jgi:hypothetical protein
VAAGAVPFPAEWRWLPGRVRHALSSYEVEFAVMVAAGHAVSTPDNVAGSGRGAVWVRREDLESEALSSLARKLVRHALAATTARTSRRAGVAKRQV